MCTLGTSTWDPPGKNQRYIGGNSSVHKQALQDPWAKQSSHEEGEELGLGRARGLEAPRAHRSDVW